MSKLQLSGILVLWMISCLAFAETRLAFVPPLASEAKAAPDKFPEQVKADKENAERSRYSVMIGSHDFDGLEKEANTIIARYRDKKISGDEFIAQLFTMVPLISGKLQIPDLMAWTQAKPASYTAWYVLGRQYVDVAKSARGGKWASETSEEQFADADKYARLGRDALLKSLALDPKPLLSYKGLIMADNFISKNRAEEQEKYILRPHPQLDYLKAAILLDPDSTFTYEAYFTYNSPRWGGTYEPLEALVSQARQSGMVNAKSLAAIEAALLVQRGNDAVGLEKNPARAAELFTKAFDISPEPENVVWLYWAAVEAKKAHNIDEAFKLYDRIIATRAGEYEAYFLRGVMYREEKNDVAHHFADQIASAKLGYMYAQNNIGFFYMTGDSGFPVNLDQAKAWLTLAANQGYQHAKDKLPLVEAKLAQQDSSKTGNK
jgi:TPR repeat protein